MEILFLLLHGQPHQHEVPYFISFTQIHTGGVQAFENQLGIVVLIQSNIYNLQTA